MLFGWIGRCEPDVRILENQTQHSGKVLILYMKSLKGCEQAGTTKWFSHLEKFVSFLFILKLYLTCVTAIPLLSITQINENKCPHKDFTQLSTATLSIIARGYEQESGLRRTVPAGESGRGVPGRPLVVRTKGRKTGLKFS